MQERGINPAKLQAQMEQRERDAAEAKLQQQQYEEEMLRQEKLEEEQRIREAVEEQKRRNFKLKIKYYYRTK